MKLSIITINFNNAPGLRKTIESVVNQTSNDFEYIIIDGGSKDGSVDAIRKYEDNITYWISEPDTGIYNAMNKGIKAAKGEYCQFLNSGDTLVAADVTEKMLHDFPGTSIIIGNMLKNLPFGKILSDKGTGNKKPTFLTFYRATLNHSPAYIKHNLFEKYGYYDENLKIVSDWKFYLITVGLNNEEVTYRDIDMTLFDMDGISNSNMELVKQERKKVLEEMVPANILADYNNNLRNILQAKRINRYRLTRFIFWLIERILFEWEKIIEKKIIVPAKENQ